MTLIALDHQTDAQCIRLALTQGDIKRAWHNYLKLANNVRKTPDRSLLIELLTEIDAAAVQSLGLAAIDPEAITEMSEETLTYRTSNALENALSYFVEKIRHSDTYKMNIHARRTLRLYTLFEEPLPHSDIARELIANPTPNLCPVHIPHPALPA